MAFSKRNDGVYVKDLPPFKRLFPYVMPTRTESLVYFSEKIDMTGALALRSEVNRGRSTAERISLFHIFLAAAARTLAARPELNRFVAGRRIYRHNDISITFIVKKELTEEAPETEARIVFEGNESLTEVRDLVNRHLMRARSTAKAAEDDLVNTVATLPRPLVRLVAWLIRQLDYHNVLPRFMQSAIPLYTSLYLTNVGSIGLEAPYHHLYEMGSSSLFMAIGKLHKEPFVAANDEIVPRECVNVTFTLDERISEGFYCARTIAMFRELMEHPEALLRKASTLNGVRR